MIKTLIIEFDSTNGKIIEITETAKSGEPVKFTEIELLGILTMLREIVIFDVRMSRSNYYDQVMRERREAEETEKE